MKKIAFIQIIFAFIFLQLANAYQYALTVASIFKDEAPYLREWIEYHKMMGVEHFRLYNNDSEDDYLAVLNPYIQKGEVTLIDFPSSQKALSNWPLLTQWPSCVDAIKYFTGKSKWLALIDVDEFLFPLESSNMVLFLEDYEMYPGVVLSWQCFGTSFVDKIFSGQLMIESFTLKAKELSVRNIPVKSIVRPDYVDIRSVAWVPHTYFYLTNALAVFPDKQECLSNLDVSKWRICTEKAVINHYVHRSEQYFWNVKIPKKLRMENGKTVTAAYAKSWHEDCNQVEDKKIFRFVPALKQKMF